MSAPDTLLVALRQQMQYCERAGAPFTAALMAWLSHDWAAGGPVRQLLPQWPGDPQADAVPLRLAGALHALVLGGQAPALAALYPPYVEQFDSARLTPVLKAVFARHDLHLRAFLAGAPQTNEPQRSAVLLGGFALIAQAHPLPLSLREVGASAGLNLLWDRYGYKLGEDRFWGPPRSPVQLTSDWRGQPPALPSTIDVADRQGCDLAPLSLLNPASALRLAAFVWPEQRGRLARLQAAIALARRAGPAVAAADAAAWVERQLSEPRPGRTTVIYHSICWQYMSKATRTRLHAAVDDAGARATALAPLAWLTYEPPSDAPIEPELRLTVWPGGWTQRLARAHPHGDWVEWFDPE
jgi:hypothetical protein